jgi:hypothetical protein
MAITATKLGGNLPIIMSDKNKPPSNVVKQYPQNKYTEDVQIISQLFIPYKEDNKNNTCYAMHNEDTEPIGFSPLITYKI